ncbi:MAG TPA: CGNR zinc finger domain-containing protein [Terrimesophilobacter sp.]|nr:CGNR zinc finger domain-containing protein [Terrimesophilobacter sp.]
MKRPLTGEPLAVDLANTLWRSPDGEHDLLETTAGLGEWLAERGVSARLASEMSAEKIRTEKIRAALVHTRSVLRGVFDGDAGAEERLNAILARGLVVRSLERGRVRQHPILTDEAWELAWLAADDYLRLRESGADSIRQCEHPACMLYFYDTTGRRRWCSMAGCGNRAKAQRHYARQRSVSSR